MNLLYTYEGENTQTILSYLCILSSENYFFALTGLVWDLQDTPIFFLGYFTREKLARHFSSLKSARSRGIVNRKRKDREYYNEKTSDLYSGISNLEMKSDVFKGSTSVKEVNTAAVFSRCF